MCPGGGCPHGCPHGCPVGVREGGCPVRAGGRGAGGRKEESGGGGCPGACLGDWHPHRRVGVPPRVEHRLLGHDGPVRGHVRRWHGPALGAVDGRFPVPEPRRWVAEELPHAVVCDVLRGRKNGGARGQGRREGECASWGLGVGVRGRGLDRAAHGKGGAVGVGELGDERARRGLREEAVGAVALVEGLPDVLREVLRAGGGEAGRVLVEGCAIRAGAAVAKEGAERTSRSAAVCTKEMRLTARTPGTRFTRLSAKVWGVGKGESGRRGRGRWERWEQALGEGSAGGGGAIEGRASNCGKYCLPPGGSAKGVATATAESRSSETMFWRPEDSRLTARL